MFKLLKGSLLSKLVVAVLFCAMIATTAVSFSYWVSDVNGSEGSHDLNITIGQGNIVGTQIGFEDLGADYRNKRLVPAGEANGDNDIEEAVFEIKVSWKGVDAQGESLTGVTGTLRVRPTTIMIGSTDYTALNTNNDGTTPLFDVRITSGDEATITCNGAAVEVVIKVTLNSPRDKEQYSQIAGKDVHFGFDFEVESDYVPGDYT